MFYDKFVLNDGTELKDSIVNVTWTTSSNSDSDIIPGSVCASAVEIEFWVNSDSALSITQGTILTYYKVEAETNKETKIGIFTCDKPEKNGANKYTVTAYDNVTLLDVDVSDWLNSFSFPATIKTFAAGLAEQCGLSLSNVPRLNSDYEIQSFTGSGVNGRDLMKQVCAASGCFCIADADGKLSFNWYKKNNNVAIMPSRSKGYTPTYYLFDVVSKQLFDNVPRALITADGEKIPDGIPYFINALTFSDFTVQKIDKVQVKQTNSDVGVIYPESETGTNAIVIQGNQLLATMSDANLRPCVKNLYEGLNDIVYVPCSNIETPETLEIKVGDIVTVSDGKKKFTTWITSVRHSGNKCTFESVGNANRNTTTAVNNVKYSSKQKILEISATVDGLTVKAEQTEQDISGLSSQYTQLKQTFDKFEVTAVTDGNVRSKFALDPSSVVIESGTITFKGDTLVVDSDNFKLSQDGTVRITGTLTSRTTYSEAVIGNGEITLSQMVSGGSYSPAVRIYSDGEGSSYILGHIRIYGNDGYNDNRIDLYNDSAGSHFEMYTGGTHTKFFDVRADSNGEGHVSIGGVNALGYLECKRLRIDGHNVALSRVNYTNSEGTPTWEYLLTAHQGDAW